MVPTPLVTNVNHKSSNQMTTTDRFFSFFNQTPSISTLLKTSDMCEL
jgi:hypothetical protein